MQQFDKDTQSAMRAHRQRKITKPRRVTSSKPRKVYGVPRIKKKSAPKEEGNGVYITSKGTMEDEFGNAVQRPPNFDDQENPWAECAETSLQASNNTSSPNFHKPEDFSTAIVNHRMGWFSRETTETASLKKIIRTAIRTEAIETGIKEHFEDGTKWIGAADTDENLGIAPDQERALLSFIAEKIGLGPDFVRDAFEQESKLKKRQSEREHSTSFPEL